MTILEENTRLDATITSGETPIENMIVFTWSYEANGINTLDKCVSIGYQDGLLKYFMDTWDLRKVGSTTVNLSEKQAEDIAMKNVKTYTYTLFGENNQTIEINNFNVTEPVLKQLIFMEAGAKNGARDSDRLALYPVWRIGVGLDNYYPGNVYGIYVDIWADTGQIKEMHEAVTSLSSPGIETVAVAQSSIPREPAEVSADVNVVSASWVPLGLFAFISIGTLITWQVTKLRSKPSGLPKMRKISAIVLCVLLLGVALLSFASAFSTANAAAVANIWGETATGSVHHTAAEIYAQQVLSANINTWWGNAGYAHNNFQAPGQTTKSNVLFYTGNTYTNLYSSVETVYFDHGIGMPGGDGIGYPYQNEWHYMLCTDLSIFNVSTYNVFDYQLYNAASSGKGHFSYISACHAGSQYSSNKFSPNYPNGCTGTYGANPGPSGSGNIIGMPYAWTHGASMSTNAFVYPDAGAYCYLSFQDGSPSLCQVIDNRPSGTITYGSFVYLFFDALLNVHLTVNQALDHAAHQAFPPEYFVITNLWIGFTGIWPDQYNVPKSGDGKMVIYGNADMYLYTGGPDYVATPTISGPATGYANTAYQYTAYANDPYGYTVTYTINWGDGSSPTVTTNPNGVSHTWTSMGVYNIKVTAQSQKGIQCLSPRYYQVVMNDPTTRHVSVSATADVAATASQFYTIGTSPTISWQCGDDYGVYYCHITEVIVDGVVHSPTDYGSVNAGSITFSNLQTDHTVVVHSAPNVYPVTFYQYAHNGIIGNMLVSSWTEYRVAWEERDGPVYCHGSNVFGGGAVSQNVAATIADPWGYGTSSFAYAYVYNWGSGSEQMYYSKPFDVTTYTWGNTVDVWYWY